MLARDRHLPPQADQTGELAAFCARNWNDEIEPALGAYFAIPVKSPMFAAAWQQHGFIERVVGISKSREDGGSLDLPACIDLLGPRLDNVSLVVCLDSGTGNYYQRWLTTRLRGMVSDQNV